MKEERNTERMTWPEAFLYLAMIVPWVMGVAITKGFWMTLACFCLPPVAWVVTAGWVITLLGGAA
ncbi:hypothetical protein [Cronobacter malonaticus]|uniref:hypothetical protein n=1 Tax=Cronobacter malonaticus TaxID=413503 RepID=UPI000CFDCA5D|nr:hypothetical protein [Cronobacter malonaticus]